MLPNSKDTQAMPLKPAISVKNLGKRYRLGIKEQRSETLVGAALSVLKAPLESFKSLRRLSNFDDADSPDILWALRDVSFDVQPGEVVGIIGRNGAGKSTLLKILSSIVDPSHGHVDLHGRVASLLEVGTGFHPELTGRENIYLNGAVLGMTKREIDSKFDEIVTFSGIERFIETPVKRYSSGMSVRLAFAVAAHLEPEILMVDEVLAVGDAEFQARCLNKMQDVSNSDGRTVLFVSHDLGAVQRLCPRSILLEKGQVVMDGETSAVIEHYLNSGAQADRFLTWTVEEAPQSKHVRLEQIQITDAAGRTDSILNTESEILLAVDYQIFEPIRDLRVVLNLLNSSGTTIFSVSDFWSQPANRTREPGRYRSHCRVPGNILNIGRYFASIDLDIPKTEAHIKEVAVSFTISELVVNHLGFTFAAKPAGLIHPKLDWVVESRL